MMEDKETKKKALMKYSKQELVERIMYFLEAMSQIERIAEIMEKQAKDTESS